MRYGTVDAAAGVAAGPRAASTNAVAIRRSRLVARTPGDERNGRRLGIVKYRFFNRHFRGLASARTGSPIEGPELHVTAQY